MSSKSRCGGVPGATGRAALIVTTLALVATAPFLAGCGKKKFGPDESESGQVAAEVRAIPDRTGNAQMFRDAFVEGSAPADSERARYSKYGFEPIGTPRIAGETATVEVRVYDDRAGKDVGNVTWTLVKQGEKWKLKTAPLP